MNEEFFVILPNGKEIFLTGVKYIDHEKNDNTVEFYDEDGDLMGKFSYYNIVGIQSLKPMK